MLMWTVIVILIVGQLTTIVATLRLFWWAKVSSHLHIPVRFASTNGLQAAWRILNSRVKPVAKKEGGTC